MTPSDPSTAAELLAFNASVRWAGERMAVCPFLRGVASSEAETWGAVEGLGGEPSSEAEIALRVQGGLDGPHYVLGPWIELFLVLSFSPDWKEDVGLSGPICLTCVLHFEGD